MLFFYGCSSNCAQKVSEIRLSSPGNNAIRVNVAVFTTDTLDTYIKYWVKDGNTEVFNSPLSKHQLHHNLILTNLKAQETYEYSVVTKNNNCEATSKTYSFKTQDYPIWIKDAFKVICPDTLALPAKFKDGYVMVYRRELPGIFYFLNYNGEIVWYHQVNETGVKVAHFTDNKTILSILGNETYETSYGDEILEISLTGDTIFHLKKGQKDLQQTIHHEILLTPENNIATISVEQKIMDLSSVGGTKNDTIKSDGILILDRSGKKVWQWSIFDVLDPLKEKNIVKEHKDWMHANSLAYDKDGNFLLSFYNNGQIWKIDSKTGKVIWKFGKGGNFAIPKEMIFDQSHAVHLNKFGDLMFFDNGTSKKVSRTLSFTINESEKKASAVINTILPADTYNERMGSSYLVADTTLLTCASKRNAVLLTNMKSTFLWMLRTGTSPYRAEFISKEKLAPFIER
ncbi:MAG: aryl-sulfate sulfotransferase [Chitinophagaceae bacterium]|nr:aryl-sulfate sulfotransferase [Chitinophagaceae bacterium]